MRYLNTSMEIWTLAVIVVESAAQIFYQALKDATNCGLLKQICTDILIDETYHIAFQTERLAIIYHSKSNFSKVGAKPLIGTFFMQHPSWYGLAIVAYLKPAAIVLVCLKRRWS